MAYTKTGFMKMLLSVIEERWSPRALTEPAPDPETLIRIFSAARLAPSSMNEQPWIFLAGKKGDKVWDGLLSSLVEFNKLWAVNSPVLVLASGRKYYQKGDQSLNPTYAYDTGQAVAFLTLQAMQEGVYAHQMGGFDKEEVTRIFSLPEGLDPITIIALGYKGMAEILPSKIAALETGPKPRLPLESIIFGESLGDSPWFL